MIHVSKEYVTMEVGSPAFWIANLFDSVSRAAVPLFVMISGALMLDENYTFTREKWINRIIKMLSFFIFWSIVYALIFEAALPVIRHKNIIISDIVWDVLKGHYHLWFIPMIIALYLIVPLLRLWVKRQNRRYVEYFLILALVFSFVIPHFMETLIAFNSEFYRLRDVVGNAYMYYTVGFTAYFILGWYLHNFELPYKKTVYILGLVGVFVSFSGTYLLCALSDTKKFLFYENFAVNVLLYSVAIFVAIKARWENRLPVSAALIKIVDSICKHSQGIYAVHVGFLFLLLKLTEGIHAAIAVPLIFILCALLSCLLSSIISKIPFLKRFV